MATGPVSTKKKKKKKAILSTFKEKQHSKCVPELEAPGACICNDFWIFFPKPTKSRSTGLELENQQTYIL